MTRLIAGMDMSGSAEMGQDRFIAIVIGTLENIDSTNRQIQNNLLKSKNLAIHTSQIKPEQLRYKVASSISFNNKDKMALCIKINKHEIIEKNLQKRRKNKYDRKKKLLRKFNSLLIRMVRDKITAFLRSHKCEIHDVVFQCDSDCLSFAKDASLRYDPHGGSAYELSDVVAWANHKDHEPEGTVSIDVTRAIEARLNNLRA